MAEAEVEEREQDIDLDADERAVVEEREQTSAVVIHEVIRRHGDAELERPALSLLFSGLAAGIAISASILGQAMMERRLPGTPWAPLVASFGYTLGFVIVILGRLQLFTESTLSAVLPVATHPGLANLGRLLRLWGLVLLSNLVGTLLVAWLFEGGLIGTGDQREAMLALSRKLLAHDGREMIALGIPAGFLIAAVPWALPSARGQEFWVIVLLTYAIALGGFAHVVAGSGEAWMLVLAGETTLGHALLELMLPALVGNVIGGTGLFALLAHGQVRQEI